MTKERLDSAKFNGTVLSGSTEDFEIETAGADKVLITVDSGSTGGTPQSYDLLTQVYNTEISDYQQHGSEITQSTAFSHEFNAWGSKMRFVITNSGNDGTFRVVVKSYRELD